MAAFAFQSPLARSVYLLWATLLLASCGGPEFLLPLEGDPTEARDLLTENEYSMDYRPGSVRTAERFFRALHEKDGPTCWYLLDLRAAAAWQAYQFGKKSAEADADSIVNLLQPLFPSGPPSAIERRSDSKNAKDPKNPKSPRNSKSAVVQAEWVNGQTKVVNLAMGNTGWRMMLPPPDTALADVPQNASPTDTTEPVDYDFIEEEAPANTRPAAPPFGGGGFGY